MPSISAFVSFSTLGMAQESCRCLLQIEGMGPLNVTAMVAAVTYPTTFKNGRQLAAWLGLVPRQYSAGHSQKLLGINKRGDRDLRTLLIHSACSVVTRFGSKIDPGVSGFRLNGNNVE